MKFHYFGIIMLSLSLLWACRENTGGEGENTETTTPQEQEQAPGQDPQNPNTFQEPQQGAEVSDREIQRYISVSREMQTINQEARQEMVEAIEEQGMDVERFNEMQLSAQNPNQETEATGEELEKYEELTRDLQKIQVGAEKEMQEKLSEEGLTEMRFQEITMALQNDPELQEKFRASRPQTN